ncbi:hypothetical protein ACHQM5_023246 [Ranunculus cassubicifolius]
MLEAARRLFSTLVDAGFVPDNFTYCTLIHGFSAAGNVKEAFNIRDEMEKQGIMPNIVTYNALINGLCKSGNLNRAERLFYKLSLKGLARTVVTYNTLIHGYCQAGNIDEALKLKEKMTEEGIAPSYITYSTLIFAVCKQGDMNISLKFFKEMVDAGVYPDIQTYHAVGQDYTKHGKMQQVSELFRQIFSKDLSHGIIPHGNMGFKEACGGEGLIATLVLYHLKVSSFSYSASSSVSFSSKTHNCWMLNFEFGHSVYTCSGTLLSTQDGTWFRELLVLVKQESEQPRII